MTSIIKVDQIQNAAGGVPTASDLGINTTGTVLEQVSGWCDGRTVGGVTFPNVTAFQTVNSTSYTTVTGSNISYTPPVGTTTVLYHFSMNYYGSTNGGINHFKFYIDSEEVTIARTTQAKNYQTSNPHEHDLIDFILPIQVGGTNDVTTSKLSSWTSAKTIKIYTRTYNSTYAAEFHKNQWFNGTNAIGSDLLRHPTITLTSIK